MRRSFWETYYRAAQDVAMTKEQREAALRATSVQLAGERVLAQTHGTPQEAAERRRARRAAIERKKAR